MSRLMVLLYVFVIMSMHSISGQVIWWEDVPYHEVMGVPDSLLSLDVAVPVDAVDAPTLIYVHGGGWVTGDKSNVGAKADFFLDQGFIFVSVNYRLSPFPYEVDNPDRITYPTHPDDVARAVAFVLDRVEEYGGAADKVSLMGHSTGAHIVSTIVADQRFLQAYGYRPSDLACVCSNDIAGYDIPEWLSIDIANQELYLNAFTRDTILQRIASPTLQIDQVDIEMPDMLVITRGRAERQQQSYDFVARIEAMTSAQVTIFLEDQYTHSEVNQLLGVDDDPGAIEYSDRVMDWFKECVSGTVAIEDQPRNQVKVWPQPSLGHLFVDTGETYTIADLNGRVLAAGLLIDAMPVDVSNLSTGNYTLMVYDALGVRILSRVISVR